MSKFKIKRDDVVIVTAGKHKGRTGKVLQVLSDKSRVVVEKVNLVKRHVKPQGDRPGGTVEKEASLHISNVALLDQETGKPSRSVGSSSTTAARSGSTGNRRGHRLVRFEPVSDNTQAQENHGTPSQGSVPGSAAAGLMKEFSYKNSMRSSPPEDRGQHEHQGGHHEREGLEAAASKYSSPGRSPSFARLGVPSPDSRCARACRLVRR